MSFIFLKENEDNNKKILEYMLQKDENRVNNIYRNHKINLHLSKSSKNSINSSKLFFNESNIYDKQNSITPNFFKNPIFKNEMILKAFSTIRTVTENSQISNSITDKTKTLPNNNTNDIISNKWKKIYSSKTATQKNFKRKSIKINKSLLLYSNNTKIENNQKNKRINVTKDKIPLKNKTLVANKTFNVDKSDKSLFDILQINSKKSIKNNLLNLYDNPTNKEINNSNKAEIFNKYNNLYSEKNDIINSKKKNFILTSHATNTINELDNSRNRKLPFINNKVKKLDYSKNHLFTQEFNQVSSNPTFKIIKIFLNKNIKENCNKTKYCSSERDRRDKNRLNNLIKKQKFKAHFFNVNSKNNSSNIMKA